ncbi:RB1-inducible coiled-coil protein 1-like isoform X2 [Homalodisca vitripennis]|uniref:RB1-inducible coiled-coil protein 1-like isoform X2 n=1 Tax=Homalodisca vitripennis TaxID=197043 RepID=UPI001EEB1383|nr:RB1-inducible coiled-coil protein 1-like isoform X2 [Homalodisca vitripennis]
MLYMFDVDAGTMMTFDMSLSMDLVSVLQEHIQKVLKIPIVNQVLLVSGGIALSPSQRVCAFSAGTDTNPIFLYNKQYYLHPGNVAPLDQMVFDAGPDLPDMQAEVDASLMLPDTINSVMIRSQLAHRFCEMAQTEMQACERLVHEQHLQHQGFMAVIANMDDTVPSVKNSTEQFLNMFQEFLENKPHYLQLSETVQDVAATLATIPLLPSLVEQVPQDPMTSITSCKDIEGQRDNMSLLDWLQLRSSNDSFHQLSQICTRGLQQYTEEMVSNIQILLTNMLTSFTDENLRSIKGLPERFSGLEKLLKDARVIVQEQGDLAQAIHQNSTRASNLGDNSILPDLCASHRRQLILMQTNHKRIKDVHRRVVIAKTELIQTIYIRLKWAYGVECQMSILSERIHMISSGLKTLKDELNILQQTHSVPHLYLTAVAEVVRRRTFSHAFLMWANDLACQLCAVHSEEVARRQNFQTQFEGHILSNLFPGLGDVPPPFATQAPKSFDTKLPKLGVDDIRMLQDKVADFALSVSLPDLNAITQFFVSKSITNPMKPKEVERLVEEVTAMEQPLESQAAGSGYLATVLPIMDRGFESETDTEEFEKVGQSPTDMALDTEKRADSAQEKVSQLHQTKEEVQKSIVTIRNDLSSLKEWLQSEHNHVHSFLQQLTTAYRSEVDLKDQHIYQLRQEMANREEEIEELRKRLTLSLQAETRERELREQVEAARDLAVREATEQLLQDHRREMEAVRSRFRLMATATSMERSPSELSLERMDHQRMSLESEEVVAQVRAELVQERDRAVAEERQRWQSKLDHEIHQLKIRADAEKQIWFNEAMRRVLVEKDRQLESLRLHSLHIESECQKHRETIQRLTGTSGSVGSESSLLERVEALEAAKVRLEAELAEARSSPTPHGTPSHQDMSTSIALCDGDGGLRDAATSPDPARKTQLKEKLSKSTTTLIQQGRVSVGSCNIGDAVLVVWEENYHSYMILQESSTLYFLHPDSLAAMSLFPSSDGSPRQIYYCTAEVVEKEYCHARKNLDAANFSRLVKRIENISIRETPETSQPTPQQSACESLDETNTGLVTPQPVNRYNVAKGTKFYRVKVKPLTVLTHHSQSSSGCSA